MEDTRDRTVRKVPCSEAGEFSRRSSGGGPAVEFGSSWTQILYFFLISTKGCVGKIKPGISGQTYLPKQNAPPRKRYADAFQDI